MQVAVAWSLFLKKMLSPKKWPTCMSWDPVTAQTCGVMDRLLEWLLMVMGSNLVHANFRFFEIIAQPPCSKTQLYVLCHSSSWVNIFNSSLLGMSWKTWIYLHQQLVQVKWAGLFDVFLSVRTLDQFMILWVLIQKTIGSMISLAMILICT